LSELTKRVLFAVPAAALFLAVTWVGGIPFQLLVGAITGVTLWEVNRIMNLGGNPGFFTLSVLIAIAIWTLSIQPAWLIILFATLVLFITIWSVLDSKTDLSKRWHSTLFTGVYAPVGLLMLVHMRNLGNGMDGFWLILTFYLMIWGNDIFAYFGGKTFGKRPLAPVISPKKTWEGFWSGFPGAGAGFLIVYLIASSFPLPLWSAIPAVMIISIIGPLGDITESSLKRLAEVKDSSALLPGHGGLFDRFDSMILSAPFIFFFFYYLIEAGF
jgi:phosphatidate cytidylyltransferase